MLGQLATHTWKKHILISTSHHTHKKQILHECLHSFECKRQNKQKSLWQSIKELFYYQEKVLSKKRKENFHGLDFLKIKKFFYQKIPLKE